MVHRQKCVICETRKTVRAYGCGHAIRNVCILAQEGVLLLCRAIRIKYNARGFRRDCVTAGRYRSRRDADERAGREKETTTKGEGRHDEGRRKDGGESTRSIKFGTFSGLRMLQSRVHQTAQTLHQRKKRTLHLILAAPPLSTPPVRPLTEIGFLVLATVCLPLLLTPSTLLASPQSGIA